MAGIIHPEIRFVQTGRNCPKFRLAWPIVPACLFNDYKWSANCQIASATTRGPDAADSRRKAKGRVVFQVAVIRNAEGTSGT